MKLLGVALLFFSLSAQAKVFRNAYVAFELPDSWKCTLEHTEWVCRSEADKESKEAIIILTAKEVGPTDSFASYTEHLNTPQTAPNQSSTTPSRIIYPPKQVKINEHVWIDGLHMGSEVPNYFTRYLATIKDRIAILVTFSAHKNFYTKYSQDFFKAVMSLRVIATKNLLADPKLGVMKPGGEIFGSTAGNMPQDMVGTEALPEDGSGSGGKTKSVLFAIAIILAAAAGYVLMKMRKK